MILASPQSLQARIELLSIPEPNSGCWIWTARVKGTRYGLRYGDMTAKVSGYTKRRGFKSVFAHRVSFEAYHGIIPDGMYVCHSCDTPVCVNPDHLFLGTPKDNSRDCISKGRHTAQRLGKSRSRLKLNEDQVLQIRNSDLSASKLATLYGVSKSSIQSILWRKTWAHI